MTINNLDEVNEALAPYVSKSSRLMDKDLKLERVLRLLEALGNPHKDLKVIHVAGTSGKTSTSYYMTALLKASGKKVGLTVSPHVDGVNERVQINGKPLPVKKFCTDLGKFLEIMQDIGRSEEPSYFELLSAFAFWVFKREKVDYAVLETGLGGLYDASNVARRRDKVCIITDIGFDHMHILGDTLAKIATQKAGIIHDRNQVFMYRQSAEIMRPIRARVKKHQAQLHVLDERAERRIWNSKLSGIVDYQQRNWLLAYGVYRYLEQRDGLSHLTNPVLAETQAVRIPGRMDITQVNGKTLVMDGAHNTQKMAAFISSFQNLYPGVKPAILISLKDNKDHNALVPLLAPFAGRIITTAFETSQDSFVRSMDPESLAKAFRQAGVTSAQAVTDKDKAFQTLLASAESVCMVTGSFYLLNQIRNNGQPA